MKWEPLSVLSKLEGDQKTGKQNKIIFIYSLFEEELFAFNIVLCFALTDLMEELGLGDVDDLEGKLK